MYILGLIFWLYGGILDLGFLLTFEGVFEEVCGYKVSWNFYFSFDWVLSFTLKLYLFF